MRHSRMMFEIPVSQTNIENLTLWIKKKGYKVAYLLPNGLCYLRADPTNCKKYVCLSKGVTTLRDIICGKEASHEERSKVKILATGYKIDSFVNIFPETSLFYRADTDPVMLDHENTERKVEISCSGPRHPLVIIRHTEHRDFFVPIFDGNLSDCQDYTIVFEAVCENPLKLWSEINTRNRMSEGYVDDKMGKLFSGDRIQIFSHDVLANPTVLDTSVVNFVC